MTKIKVTEDGPLIVSDVDGITRLSDGKVYEAAGPVDDWFLPEPENRGKAVGATAGMGAERAVVMDREIRRGVVLAPIRDSIRVLASAEAIFLVGAVAKRLVLRPPAAAKGDLACSLVQLPVRQAGDPVDVADDQRAVISDLDLRHALSL